jgi:hypothetical protein
LVVILSEAKDLLFFERQKQILERPLRGHPTQDDKSTRLFTTLDGRDSGDVDHLDALR